MKRTALACALFWSTIGAVNPNLPTSTSIPDRIDRTETRIGEDVNAKVLSEDQAKLFRAGLAAIKALAATDSSAFPMLDELDRDLAIHDRVLAAPEDGMQFVVQTGESVTVAMHDERQWTVTTSDPNVLAPPRVGVMWARGVQGVFVAKSPGESILTLQGRNVPEPGAVATPTNIRLVRFYITVVAQR